MPGYKQACAVLLKARGDSAQTNKMTEAPVIMDAEEDTRPSQIQSFQKWFAKLGVLRPPLPGERTGGFIEQL
jgi:hypothetical protein